MLQQRVVLPEAEPERHRDDRERDDQTPAQLLQMVNQAKSLFMPDPADGRSHDLSVSSSSYGLPTTVRAKPPLGGELLRYRLGHALNVDRRSDGLLRRRDQRRLRDWLCDGLNGHR